MKGLYWGNAKNIRKKFKFYSKKYKIYGKKYQMYIKVYEILKSEAFNVTANGISFIFSI